MVVRNFVVHHNDSDFDVEYDTNDGLEVLKFQLFSLTSVPPDEQKIFGVENGQLVSEDVDLVSISDKLRLVLTNDKEDRAENVQKEKDSNNQEASSSFQWLESDEELARKLQAEEEALLLQPLSVGERDSKEMEARLRPYIDRVRLYEDPIAQEKARKTVPIEELEEKALVSLAKEGNFKPSKGEQDHAFLMQLLYWFKQSFRWVNAPPCEYCGSETVNQGMGAPLPSELQDDCTRVEFYCCRFCLKITRFPRYNNPVKLLETRRGRCGEWANCFTFYCRSFGYESRLILDFTDHVWTEFFSQHLGRWLHLDPCDAVYDRPLLYEKGWNKKLNYVIAFAIDGVYDVTKRYTKKWHEVLSRRDITTEEELSTLLTRLREECRRSFTSELVSALEDRDKKELEAIERDLNSADDASITLPGRQSGDKEWRIQRLEIGVNDKSSLSSSSCPVRMCVDEHVTRIYNAFSPLLSHFAENSDSQPTVVKTLEMFRKLLEKVKNSPFKSRRVSLDSVSDDAQAFMLLLLLPLSELLDTVSLKCENTGQKCDICLAGDPVKTSLSLPVALEALDDTIKIAKQHKTFTRDLLSLPLLKCNRIHSGSVLASGEELPLGIATSAFDGTRETKWEEPNGARGGWIIYKVSGNDMHELVAYELMSANDAPERDPKDWVLEGSKDGGANWQILDRQSSQVFESRFQRKMFEIRLSSFPCNMFRFRFLAVKGVQSNSRFQIGSIDLYARR